MTKFDQINFKWYTGSTSKTPFPIVQPRGFHATKKGVFEVEPVYMETPPTNAFPLPVGLDLVTSSFKGQEDSIYCENGWYNTAKNIARFQKKGKV